MLYISQIPILNNIINFFNIKEVFTSSEQDEIELTMVNLMDHFIESDPLRYSSPNFHSNLKHYVYKNICILLQHLYDEDILEEEINKIYDKINKIYFKRYYPIRSYDNSFIRIKPNIDMMNTKINHIENKPQPDQRTKEWYEFRYNLITASNAWKALKSQAAINQLVVEKCKDLDTSKSNVVNTSTPMHHGNKYEDVSIMFYEEKYNTKVKEYGCVKHDTHNFLGASPDGINVDITSDRYGRMVEIKNPTSRELTGIPKEDYWIQMQLQMEVCNLNECDFLETVFKEYESKEEFTEDGNFTYSNKDELKGIIMYFMKEGKPHYEYMPLYLSETDFEIWENKIMEKNSNITWVTNLYWRLEDYSSILVLRNKLWFQHAIPKIENVWDIIKKERITGYEHRLPKKNIKSSRSNSLTETPKNNCLINVNELQNQIIYINTGCELDISAGTN